MIQFQHKPETTSDALQTLKLKYKYDFGNKLKLISHTKCMD